MACIRPVIHRRLGTMILDFTAVISVRQESSHTGDSTSYGYLLVTAMRLYFALMNALVVVKIFVKTFSYNFYHYDWMNLFFINGIFSVRRSRNFVI